MTPCCGRPAIEDFSSYGRLVESLKVAADRSGMRIKLRPEARWHDGKPITAADVVWTFETLTTEGAPIYRYYYKDVTKAEVVGPREVAFSFSPTGSLELPSIVGQLPVLPKHYWQGRDSPKPPWNRRLAAALPDRRLRARPFHRARARSPITGGRTFRSTRGAITSPPCAPSITATAPSCWRRSRPAKSITGAKTARGAGPPAMISRPSTRAWSRSRPFPTAGRPACRLCVQPAPAAVPGPAGARGAGP